MTQHEILKRYIQGLAKGLNTCLIVNSPSGYGKTETTLETMRELNFVENEHYRYIPNYITPRALVNLLEEVNKLKTPKLLILDDPEETLRNTQSIGILKGALWTAGGKRKVSWITARKKIEFDFTGRIIFLLNKLNEKNPIIQALKDRALYYEMKLSLSDIYELIRKRAEIPYHDIPLEKRKEIAEFIIQQSKGKENISLRMLEKAYNLFLLSPNHYRNLISEIL